MLVAVVVGSLSLRFLLATGTCHPSPVWAYIYAIFTYTGYFTLNKEAAWTPEMLVPYQKTTWHHNPKDLNLKDHCHESYETCIKIGFVACSPWFFPHTDTLHQPVKTRKKAVEIIQQFKTFFHTHQGMFHVERNWKGVSITTTHFEQC